MDSAEHSPSSPPVILARVCPPFRSLPPLLCLLCSARLPALLLGPNLSTLRRGRASPPARAAAPRTQPRRAPTRASFATGAGRRCEDPALLRRPPSPTLHHRRRSRAPPLLSPGALRRPRRLLRTTTASPARRLFSRPELHFSQVVCIRQAYS